MREIAFFFCLAAVALCYAAYPLLVGLAGRIVSLRAAAGGPPDEAPAVMALSVTIVIPAYNEQAVIARKLANCFLLEHPPERIEILVLCDGCTDGTAEAARRAAALAPASLRVAVIEHSSRRGKTACINDAVLGDPVPGESRGEILVHTDANTLIDAGALRFLLAPFSDPRVGCVIGELIYENSDDPEVAGGEGLYWRYDNFIKQNESLLGCTITANGGLYALRRRFFEPLPPHIAGDAVDPLLVLRQGHRALFERRARARERAAAGFSEEFARKVRIMTQGLSAWIWLRGLLWPPRPLLALEYFAHKMLRWILPLFLVVAFLSSAALAVAWPHAPRMAPVWFYRAAFAAQVLLLGIGAAGWRAGARSRRAGTGPFGRFGFVCGYFLMANTAAVLALINVARGRRLPTWDTSSSTRENR